VAENRRKGRESLGTIHFGFKKESRKQTTSKFGEELRALKFQNPKKGTMKWLGWEKKQGKGKNDS